MSKTKERAPKEAKEEKKRKRQEEGEDVPKKSKKSRKSDVDQDAPAADALVVEETVTLDKKAEKEEKKKRKKERKEKDAAEAGAENGAANDDAPMPDATDDSTSKDEKKKSKRDKKEKKEKNEKKDKKDKKSKKFKDAPEEDIASAEEQNNVVKDDVAATNSVDVDSKEEKKKAKKEKKEKKEKKSKKSKKNDAATAEEEPAAETNGDATAGESAEAGAEEEGEEATEPGKKGRFIVFVGNLPYSATKESISAHFEKLHPTEIRLRTYKGTEKFMGTCFVEFDRFDRMETCLKKYHHSVFPDGKTKEGRKINVELSAGGGGNSENRKSRITAKNDKLHDERARDREKRAELEMKQGERKEKKDKLKNKGDKGEAEEDAGPDNAGMHPARLAMMQAPARPMHRQRY